MMTTDIVDRLRAYAELVHKAADEIERLQAEVIVADIDRQRLKAEDRTATGNEWMTTIATATCSR